VIAGPPPCEIEYRATIGERGFRVWWCGKHRRMFLNRGEAPPVVCPEAVRLWGPLFVGGDSV